MPSQQLKKASKSKFRAIKIVLRVRKFSGLNYKFFKLKRLKSENILNKNQNIAQ